MNNLLALFIEFFKTGLFAVGGGLATIPFLYDMADKYPWFNSTDIADMLAVSESTPGPIGINMATYAGFKNAGVLGGVVATASIVLPSLIVIILISGFLEKFRDSSTVNKIFLGIRPLVTGLVASVGFSVISDSVLDANSRILLKEGALFVVAFIAVNKIKLRPIFFILSAAVIGNLFSF